VEAFAFTFGRSEQGSERRAHSIGSSVRGRSRRVWREDRGASIYYWIRADESVSAHVRSPQIDRICLA
jgi:hypothetical protein